MNAENSMSLSAAAASPASQHSRGRSSPASTSARGRASSTRSPDAAAPDAQEQGATVWLYALLQGPSARRTSTAQKPGWCQRPLAPHSKPARNPHLQEPVHLTHPAVVQPPQKHLSRKPEKSNATNGAEPLRENEAGEARPVLDSRKKSSQRNYVCTLLSVPRSGRYRHR